MSDERILLFELRERTSAAGNRYLSGWLGKASVVAFLDREAEQPTWQVFVSTPSQRNDAAKPRRSAGDARSTRRRTSSVGPATELNDTLNDIWRRDGRDERN